MPGPGKRQKAPRAWARLMERKRNKTKGSKKRAKRPSTGPSGGQGYSGWKGGPWGGNEGGRVETEDQRSKRKEKEDANVRGYYHGGGVHSGLPSSMAGIQRASAPLAGSPAAARQVVKKQRGYGQAQEGGTGYGGGGKVKGKK